VPSAAPPVEFYSYPDVPADAVRTAKRIIDAARLDVGGIEYLETTGGRRVFYDVNANSNLRPSIAAEWGFDPFERVVDYLVDQIARVRTQPPLAQ
jgi:glutathione synthase/RimK-type ligase-like ATP-grasp enzyme